MQRNVTVPRVFCIFLHKQEFNIRKINEIYLASEFNSEKLNILYSSTTRKKINKLRLQFFLDALISYRIRNPSLYHQKTTMM